MVVLLQKILQDKKKKKLICAPKNLQDYKKKGSTVQLYSFFLFHLKATEASDSHVKCLCYMPTFLLSFSSLLAKAFCLLAKLSQGSTAAETSTAFILVQFPASFVVHTKN